MERDRCSSLYFAAFRNGLTIKTSAKNILKGFFWRISIEEKYPEWYWRTELTKTRMPIMNHVMTVRSDYGLGQILWWPSDETRQPVRNFRHFHTKSSLLRLTSLQLYHTATTTATMSAIKELLRAKHLRRNSTKVWVGEWILTSNSLPKFVWFSQVGPLISYSASNHEYTLFPSQTVQRTGLSSIPTVTGSYI